MAIRRAGHGIAATTVFLPLFCQSSPSLAQMSTWRPGNTDAAKHAGAIRCLPVSRLRRQWLSVRIIFRGNSGFRRWRIMDWCKRHDLKHLTDITRNPPITCVSQAPQYRSFMPMIPNPSRRPCNVRINNPASAKGHWNITDVFHQTRTMSHVTVRHQDIIIGRGTETFMTVIPAGER